MTSKLQLGGKVDYAFSTQFPKSKLNQASMACTPIHLLSNDGNFKPISHGSGFFWRTGETVYLVTARHVLTGKSWLDNSPISKEGYLPEHITVFPTIIVNDLWQRAAVKVSLYHGVSQLPKWLEDPEFDKLRTDIVALPCFYYGNDQKISCLNDRDDIFYPIYTAVGMNVSIAGYPSMNFEALHTPVWKQGSFASEPLLAIDNKPIFLVDAIAGPGFSGAPVFRHQFGPLPVQNVDGSMSVDLHSIEKMQFVGVYSGRIDNSHPSREIPYAFYANRLEIIVNQKIP